jgi:hypothetical protein
VCCQVPISYVPFLAAPQPALSRHPRDRVGSQASPPQPGTSQPPIKRATTLAGDGMTPADSSNPVIMEMRKGRFLDVDNALSRFLKLNKDIRLFCQQCSDHIARLEPIPWPTVHSSFSPESSPAGKPAHDFLSLEDYLYFVLLSIINRRLCEDIFRPFHPAAPVQESDRYKREYSRLTGTWHVSIFSGALAFKSLALQAQSAKWRSEIFSSIDNRVNADIFANLIRKFADTIIHELNEALEQLTDQLSFPNSPPGLDSILKDAYNWNRTVKKDILKYDFEPYVIDPLSTWDPAQMESFERIRIPIRPQSKVVSSVSLGLVESVSLGNARVSRVHRKARVLLEEWFASGSRGRTMNTSPGSRSTMPVLPVPPDPRPTSQRVTEQPRPTPPMTTIPPLPQPTPRRGSLPAAPVPPVPPDPRPTGPLVTEQPRPTPPMTTIPQPGTPQPAPAGGPRRGSLLGPSGAAPVPPAPPGPRVTEHPRPTPPMTTIPQPGRPAGGPRRGSLPRSSSALPVSPVPPGSPPTGPRVTEQPRPTLPMTTIPPPGRPQPTPAGGPRRGFMCC